MADTILWRENILRKIISLLRHIIDLNQEQIRRVYTQNDII